MASESITYEQLEALLLELGFDRQTVERPLPGSNRKQKLLRYEHSDSDTVILLPEGKPEEPARPSDVLSARLHLVQKGLINEEGLNQALLQLGKKPQLKS